MGTALRLLCYKDPDPLEDAKLELAELLGTGPDEADRIVRDVLDWYHLGHREHPTGLSRTVSHLVIHVTQSHRIPVMTSRMDRILERLGRVEGLDTALDYGGGGGKDSIILARAGYRVTYADLLGDLTPWVRRRFEVRGLEIPIVDARDLDETRYDIINSMDVIEHVYDVEYIVADTMAHLRQGGYFACYPAFFNSWDGDHVEKNCGYRPYFTEMLQAVGLRLEDLFDPHGEESTNRSKRWLQAMGLRDPEMPMLLFVRDRPVDGSVGEERETIRRELYRLSRKFSARRAMLGVSLLPLVAVPALIVPHRGARRKARNTLSRVFSNSIDNLAIWRLSRRRLSESSGAERSGERRQGPSGL